MGHKNFKGSVSVENQNGRIRLRWRYQSKRYSLNLFSWTRANVTTAKKLASQIETDIVAGKFDTTLSAYRLTAIQRKINLIATDTSQPKKELENFADYFEYWTSTVRNMDCDKNIDYHACRNMIKWWGYIMPSEVATMLRQESISPKTYNKRLSMLKLFFKWMVKSRFVESSVLDEVQPKKVKANKPISRQPFTLEEVYLILDAFRSDKYCPSSSRFKHSHYYPFVCFLFYTGARNAEAIGLTCDCLDFQKETITIKTALARTLKGAHSAARVRKETKNGIERTIYMQPLLAEVLAKAIQGKQKEDLVFQSPKGLAIDDKMLQRRIFKKILANLGIKPRVLYAARHTFNSIYISQGISPVTMAFLLGNNPVTALKHYTHAIEVPKLKGF